MKKMGWVLVAIGVGPKEESGPIPQICLAEVSSGVGLGHFIGPTPKLAGTYPKYVVRDYSLTPITLRISFLLCFQRGMSSFVPIISTTLEEMMEPTFPQMSRGMPREWA